MFIVENQVFNQEDVPEFRWRGGASPPQGHSDVGPVAPNQCVKWMFGECFLKFPLTPWQDKSFQHCRILPSPSSIAAMFSARDHKD